MVKKVYILHKVGANSHYQALAYLLKKHHIKLVYREFSITSKLFKGLIKLDFAIIVKQILNLFFLIHLFFTNRKKIVVGIAPFDSKLSRLLPLFKNHTIYYHTSWASWDGTFVPKNKGVTQTLKNNWSYFLKNVVTHTFCVTSITKHELIKHYQLKEASISVVNHAFDKGVFEYKNVSDTENKFISVGRLRPDKGIAEILKYFAINPFKTITIVGKGELECLVKTYADKHSNIVFKGFIADKQKLASLYNQHSFMLLNSQKTKKWEELFGMVLIEGMACGLLPVATSHPGPKEIVKPSFGYLFKEGELEKTLHNMSCATEQQKENAILASEQYTLSLVAEKWQKIMD